MGIYQKNAAHPSASKSAFAAFVTVTAWLGLARGSVGGRLQTACSESQRPPGQGRVLNVLHLRLVPGSSPRTKTVCGSLACRANPARGHEPDQTTSSEKHNFAAELGVSSTIGVLCFKASFVEMHLFDP